MRVRRWDLVGVLVGVVCSLSGCAGGEPPEVVEPTAPVVVEDGDDAPAEVRSSDGYVTHAAREAAREAASRNQSSGGGSNSEGALGVLMGATPGSSAGYGGVGRGAGYGRSGGGVAVGNYSRGLTAPGNAGSARGSGYGRRSPAARVDRRSPPSDREGYDPVDPNRFVAVADQPLSTFSADVDTASYSNIRRFLLDGRMPPASAVRVEEMINYFRYDDPTPRAGQPFAVRTEVGDCPWAPEHQLLRVGMRTPAIESADTPARNLVFLIDVSGSMGAADKLPLLQRGMGLLVDQLRPEDHVAIVVYAGSSGLVLDSTPGTHRAKILEAIQNLRAGGSTNGGAGIELAYRTATEHFVRGGINRVILATDGDFNVGVSSQGELGRLIEEKRESGVFLTVLGFGSGNLADARMETLADRGNGNYAYIDSIDEARRVLVEEAGSTLVTVAKDVKFQVEFNPSHVGSYRLIGYENRLLAARDFNDDKRDAGELGAGHQVTVLYEIAPPGASAEGERPSVDPLRYRRAGTPSARHGSELATVKIRYKAPDGDTSRLRTFPVRVADAGSVSHDFHFAAAVAGFGLWLREDPLFPGSRMPAMRAMASESVAEGSPERRELVRLMDAAMRLHPDS